jgi:hypothetical protein
MSVMYERWPTTLDSDMKSRVPAITLQRLGDKSCTTAQTRAGRRDGQARTDAWHNGTGDHEMLCCDVRKVSSDSLHLNH